MKKLLFSVALISAMGFASCDDADFEVFTHEPEGLISKDFGIGTEAPDLSGEWLNYNMNNGVIDLQFNINKGDAGNPDSTKMLIKYAYITSVDTLKDENDKVKEIRYNEGLNDSIAKYVGEEYRMPSLAEFQNLLQKAVRCETVYNGVAGYVFKHNDKTIFLPYGTYLTSTYVSGESKRIYVYELKEKDAITYNSTGNDRMEKKHFVRPVRKLPKEMNK